MLGMSDSKNQQPEQPAGLSVSRITPVESNRSGAAIGPSISIKGDLSGDEDVVIQGRIEGKVILRENNVTVDKSGLVKADIYGKLIMVEGEVEGNLFGQDQIVVRSSGKVRGNLSAPRISIEDGARFKGNIDMGNTSDKPRAISSMESKPSPFSPPSSARTHKAGLSLRTEASGAKVG